jgi:amino acid transporter
MPTVEEGAAQGWNAFNWLIGQHPMPYALKVILAVIIVVSNFLCALAGLTSCSRMMFAFARDGGLPFSRALRKVSAAYRTPVTAIWVGAVLSIAATLYGGWFWVLATACAVFLYISYVMCCAVGLLSEINGTWTKKGPFSLGGASKLIAVLAIIGCAILIFVGVQPPNQKVGYLIVAMIVVMVVFWFAFEGRRFQGPPMTEEAVKRRQAEIAAEERAVGQAAA